MAAVDDEILVELEETREELEDTPVLETDDDLVLVDEALEVELDRVLEVDTRVLEIDRVLELDARVLELDRVLEVDARELELDRVLELDARVLELDRVLEVDTLVLVLDRLVVETTVTGLEVDDDWYVSQKARNIRETGTYPRGRSDGGRRDSLVTELVYIQTVA